MKGKVAVAGISLLLVVGVIIGVIATVGRSRANDDSLLNGGIATGMRAVETLCDPTDYKEVCKSTLTPIAENDAGATPKDLVEATFKATKGEVKKLLEKSISLAKEAGGDAEKAKLADGCRELMEYASYGLDLALSKLADSDTHTIAELADDLKNWISAVISYKSDCMDDIANHTELKSAIQDGLVNTTHLTYNALVIIDEITNILSKINATIPVHLNQRRLLNTQLNSEEYPSWVSAADRRLLQARGNPRPNVVVAKDGSGQFKTIKAAVAAYPKNHRGRFVIYVKAGIYEEIVEIPQNTVNVFMYGDGPRKTIVTGNLDYARKHIQTWKTATFAAVGNGFIAKSMGFRNTAGPEGHQAVALRTQSDMSVFYHCRIDGYQDTLYYQTQRSFFRNCIISGTVDFIFGKGSCVIQNSRIIARLGMKGNMNTVTADGREYAHEQTGLVIQNCRIVPEVKLIPQKLTVKSYLGRPWKAASRTMIMQSTIGDFLQPEGWLAWQNENNDKTCDYMEYANRGPGADVSRRINWPHYQVVKDRRVAERYTAGAFIKGGPWLRYSGVRYDLGLSP